MRKIAFLIVFIAFGLLFAGCKVDPDATFTVLYHANAMDTTGFPPVDNNQYTSGMYAVILGKNTLEKPGYTFGGWNTSADGSGISYASGDTIEITNRNVFLYAIWTKTLP